MLEKLARTRSRLRPKLRAEARTRSSLGFEYSYSLGILMLDPSLIIKNLNIEKQILKAIYIRIDFDLKSLYLTQLTRKLNSKLA